METKIYQEKLNAILADYNKVFKVLNESMNQVKQKLNKSILKGIKSGDP